MLIYYPPRTLYWWSRLSSLDKLYNIFPWPEGPGDSNSSEKLRIGLDLAKRVLERKFLANIFRGKDLVRIVDVYSDTGIGGGTNN